jgi:hypothetical protein
MSVPGVTPSAYLIESEAIGPRRLRWAVVTL